MTRRRSVVRCTGIIAVRVLFFATVTILGCWYWGGQGTRQHWQKRILPWLGTHFRIGKNAAADYTERDAAGDWVAMATAVQILKGGDDPLVEGLEYTPPALSAEALRRLYVSPGENVEWYRTPMSAKYSASPEVYETTQTDQDWIDFRTTGTTTQLCFFYERPFRFNLMPRLAVFAQPPDAFDGTPVILYWSGNIQRDQLTGEERSMTSFFLRQGENAVAYLPVGRLVEWARNPHITAVRIDLETKKPEGRFRVLALPVE